MRPQAGVDRLKPVPPMHANDLPLVAQLLTVVAPISADDRHCSNVGLLPPQPDRCGAYMYSPGNFACNAALSHVTGSPISAPASPSAFTVRFPCTPSILPGSNPRRISPA